jgi:hypothetical protein
MHVDTRVQESCAGCGAASASVFPLTASCWQYPSMTADLFDSTVDLEEQHVADGYQKGIE